MYCPFCKADDTRVVDSRIAEDGAQVRRRRECEKCGARFTTFEKAQLSMPLVLKRDGNPEPFDEEKLRKGFERALYKRPVEPDVIDHLVENIKRKLRSSSERQVPTHRLGEWVMEELRDVDQVAYVRFASIYRQFQDANAFRDEVERLLAFPSVEQRRSQLPLIDTADKGGSDKGSDKSGAQKGGAPKTGTAAPAERGKPEPAESKTGTRGATPIREKQKG